MMSDLHSMLESMAVLKASDLYLNPGAPPTFKVNGVLRWVKDTPLETDEVERLIRDSLDPEQLEKFDKNLELDVSLQIKNGGRFRLNIYRQKGSVALVARHIKNVIPTIEELQLPDILKELILAEQGLLLIVGATGVGKSSTMASMIDYRNENHQGHILTIEDPIEYIHYHKQSLVSQREIGVDTESYGDALKYALREAPDVIVIGEIRDEETAKQALRFAETGHLCVASLHASSANLAIDRLVNFFPPDAHHRIYQDVGSHLVAVVAQRLAKGVEQQRVPVVELLINNMHIATLISKGETSDIKELMHKDQANRCQTFDDALYQLTIDEKISREEASRLADSAVDISLRLRLDQEHQNGNYFSKLTDWLDEEANFSSYKTIAVEKHKITARNAKELEQKFDQAIKSQLSKRGYGVTTINPDLVLKYEFRLRVRKSSELIGVDDLSADLANIPSTEAGFFVQVMDAATSKIVWKVQATHMMESANGSVAFYEDMPNLLATLPLVLTAESDEKSSLAMR